MSLREDPKVGNLRILNWAEDDRPREKLLHKGKESLSDAELVAVLIGSGTRDLSAVELAKKVLSSASNNLHNLAKLSVHDLMSHRGIGEAKAIAIVCALELGRRKSQAPTPKRPQLTTPLEIYDYMKPFLLDKQHEEFWVLLVNQSSKVLHKEMLAKGGATEVLVDPRVVFQLAIRHQATGIIMVHNHPSGEATPSKSDYQITRKICESGEILDIRLHDHVIFTDVTYYSLSDHITSIRNAYYQNS